jgi:hypothetical protein
MTLHCSKKPVFLEKSGFLNHNFKTDDPVKSRKISFDTHSSSDFTDSDFQKSEFLPIHQN